MEKRKSAISQNPPKPPDLKDSSDKEATAPFSVDQDQEGNYQYNIKCHKTERKIPTSLTNFPSNNKPKA